MGMRCIKCGSDNVYAKDSRWRENQKLIYRSKHCVDCGTQFGTYELASPEYFRLIEADNKLIEVMKSIELLGLKVGENDRQGEDKDFKNRFVQDQRYIKRTCEAV